MVAAGLGGLSIGLLVVGLLVNQYDQRFGLNSLRTLDFGLSKLISSNSRINRRVIRRNGYYQKPTTMDNFSGYGIVDAASEAFETVKKVTEMIPNVLETVETVMGYEDYEEYTLEEAYFNQLEKEKKKSKKRRRKYDD